MLCQHIPTKLNTNNALIMERIGSIGLVTPQLRAESWLGALKLISGKVVRPTGQYRLCRKVLNQIELDAARSFCFANGLPVTSKLGPVLLFDAYIIEDQIPAYRKLLEDMMIKVLTANPDLHYYQVY